MKSFKAIREGNSVEPGVSEIDDVPEDPLSYVEIKPKKTKVVKEGIVDTAANAKVRIFSSIDRKKKELYKNAVKEDIQEAITVKKEKYSWGKMMTVHHGSDTSYPLHPEHQQAIAKLGDGEKTSFKDETNSSVHAEREGDTVHLTRPRTSSTKTSVAHSHFNEELEQGVAEDTLSELKKDTLSSYMAKARKDVDKKQKEIVGHRRNNNAINARKTMSKTMTRFDGLDRARTRLNKEETEQVVTEEWTKTGKIGTHIATGEKTFEWAKVDSEGRETGERHYRNAAGKVMGEEVVVEDTLSELKKSTLGSYAKKAKGEMGLSAMAAGAQSARGDAVSRAIDMAHAKKRSKGLDKAITRLTKEETVLETKGAPKGFHFTKDGKLKRGDADQDGNGGPMLRTDPLDKQRNKVPAVSEGIDFFKVWESIKPEEALVEEETVDPVALKKEADRIMELNIAARKAK